MIVETSKRWKKVFNVYLLKIVLVSQIVDELQGYWQG